MSDPEAAKVVRESVLETLERAKINIASPTEVRVQYDNPDGATIDLGGDVALQIHRKAARGKPQPSNSAIIRLADDGVKHQALARLLKLLGLPRPLL